MKFAVFTDLHYDAVPDGDRRIREFVQAVRKEDVDFIIDLGDLCNPSDENRHIIDELQKTGVPCHFVVGNHNSDEFPIKTVLKFFSLKKSYYSFIKGSIKFIVLNANYIKSADGYKPYDKSNYNKTKDEYPYMPEDEIEWLKNEISDDRYYYVILSHHSLANDFMKRGISNRSQIREILEERNKKDRKILFCMNGHDHGSDLKRINGIYYYTVNSMSYIWQCIKETFNYSSEIHKQYPYLKNLILYDEPLNVIVNIKDNMDVEIKGMNGHYQNVTPEDIGMGCVWNGISIDPITKSALIER